MFTVVCISLRCLVFKCSSLLIGKVTEQNLGKDFETLLGMLRPEESVNKEDIRILKEQIFGPNVFWVTGTRNTDDVLDGGIVVSQHRLRTCKCTSTVCCLCSLCPHHVDIHALFSESICWEPAWLLVPETILGTCQS